jgi:hypothetical protein
LYQVKVLEWDRTRDFFPAQLAAIQMNRSRSKETDRVWTADDFLASYYSIEKSTIPQHDPDHGAAGDWREFKMSLKGKTEVAMTQKAKRKPFIPGRE